MTHTLFRFDEELAVVRLEPGSDLPGWAVSGTLLSVTATADETSLVCAMGGVPRKARRAGPFTAFALKGPLDLGLTGVLSGLLAPLAEHQVPVFTVSTFDTDWLLVPAEHADRATDAWREAGNQVRPADQPADQPSDQASDGGSA